MFSSSVRALRGRRRLGTLVSWFRLLRLLVVVAVVGQVIAVSGTSVGAQPAVEESPEEATILLLPYLFPATEAPAGYTLTTTTAYPSEAQAFEAVMAPPPDPRPMETLLNRLLTAGRIVRLRQGFENLDNHDAPEIGFAVAAFTTPEQANAAVNDASLAAFISPNAQIAGIATPPLGMAVGSAVDGIAAYAIDETSEDATERTTMIAWQRGRLVFTVAAFGSADAANAALPMLAELAARAETRIAGAPAFPAQIPPSPAYMPAAARRLELYKALAERQLPEDAFGETMKSEDMPTAPNALLVLDSQIADPSFNDPRLVADRLLKSERRILGARKEWDTVGPEDGTASTTYPRIAVGHHVYADADGAREAMGASAAEIALRMNEEIYLLNAPTKQVMADTPSTMTLGDQTRTMTGRVMLDDGVEVQVMSVRWQRGAVELFADVAVVAGNDPSDLLRTAVNLLDSSYTSNPLPGM